MFTLRVTSRSLNHGPGEGIATCPSTTGPASVPIGFMISTKVGRLRFATLNAGRLPPGYFAMVEQRVGGPKADVITLELKPPANQSPGGVAVALLSHRKPGS